ncbi:hypothetical protein HD600_000039 [Microbacterium ginsengiterrae]|uniref:Uncharacterized protein n=1 Tax=Microbacterium ginsengiterrae TaxID=546115 RepID=A0A7W9CAD7_9MICO|nr:hypothetical protein [Microbacterium ginsengiterrae]MBB5741542.1 hypothetical protein [Microbacterium ginsengiterrae]
MRIARRADDGIRTGPAIPGAVMHLLLPIVATLAALLLPVLGWQIAVIVAAVIGMLFPQTFAGWLAIACLAVGLLLVEPEPWQSMLAVLAVHLLHVLSCVLPAVPWRGPVVLAALRPTLRRFVVVQLVAQPMTFAALWLHALDTTAVPAAALVGAAALAVFAIFLVRRILGRSRGV